MPDQVGREGRRSQCVKDRIEPFGALGVTGAGVVRAASGVVNDSDQPSAHSVVQVDAV
ncbi:MAG TPA: hypothetical protein VM736_10580 [Gemmatimonadales bacterium]|nr:hypothetical protein [Gemmatimonadales bacterium]